MLENLLHYTLAEQQMKAYHDLLKAILEQGIAKGDRTGTGTVSLFGWQSRYDLNEGLPLVTTKKLHIPSIIHELIWFIRGATNIAYLKQNGVSIWDEWADSSGDLGPIYGKQWREWHAPDGRIIDQLAAVVAMIRADPESRRLLVSAWNVADIGAMALPPCHCLFQFYVAEGRLSCQVYQRSADAFLGVPFNIACYAVLTHIIAHLTGLGVGALIHTMGDAHLYRNHIEAAREQLRRTPKPLPRLEFVNPPKALDDFTAEHIRVTGYAPDPHIKAEVAV